MRILGYIEHPIFKITVFKTDTRLAVQFEDGLCELTYRYRTGPNLEDLASVKKLLDAPFLAAVAQQLKQMQTVQHDALERYAKLIAEEEEPFEEII